MKSIFMFFCFHKVIAYFYKESGNPGTTFFGQIAFHGRGDSLIHCMHICRRIDASSVVNFDAPTCKCVRKGKGSGDPMETQTGKYFQQIEIQLKQQMKVNNTPIDGGWSGWPGWGACTVTCGNGFRNRIRTCTNPKPQHGGLPCGGKKLDRGRCSLQACPDETR